MIVVDSSAVIAIFRQEEDAGDYARLFDFRFWHETDICLSGLTMSALEGRRDMQRKRGQFRF